jgi:putative membrane protein
MVGREALGIYLRGIAMGAADAVPGVSGGTIALLTGIYPRLIAAVTAVEPDRVFSVLSAPLPNRRADAVGAFREMDGLFLAALGLGVGTAIITVSRVLEHAMATYPAATFGGFFGLIAASAWLLRGEMAFDTRPRQAAAVAGLLIAFLLSGQAEGALGHSLPVTFLAGSIAVSAMILPGVSGSLLLLLIGQYEYMIGALSAFVDDLIAMATGETLAMPPGTAIIVTFVGGALLGLFTVAHGVRWALDRWKAATMTFLVALVVGALRAPVVQTADRLEAGWTVAALAAFAGAAAVGAVVVIGVERAAGGDAIEVA